MENAIKSTWKSVGEVNMKNSAKTAYDLRIHDSYWEKKSKSRSFLEFFIFHIYAFKLRVIKLKCYFFFDGQTNILNAILFKMSLFAKYIVISKIISI